MRDFVLVVVLFTIIGGIIGFIIGYGVAEIQGLTKKKRGARA